MQCLQNNQIVSLLPNREVPLNSRQIDFHTGTTKEKTIQTVTEVGFPPSFNQGEPNSRINYTVSSFKLPNPWCYTIGRIQRLLSSSLYSPAVTLTPIWDRWTNSNRFRSYVKPALDKVITEVVFANAGDAPAILEIGAGIGYSLGQKVLSRTIRIQPNTQECQLLSQAERTPIYQTSLEELCDQLLTKGGSFPLIFALNVFDVMSRDVRRKNFERVSQFQRKGDKLLLLLDTNPYLNEVINRLHEIYPQHTPLPYLPDSNPQKISFVMVPNDKLEMTDFSPIIGYIAEVELLDKGVKSDLQAKIQEIMSHSSCPVIAVEDFFVEEVTKELGTIGYQTEMVLPSCIRNEP